MRYKQGEDRHQSKLLPPILDDYVAESNPTRVIDVFVDGLNLSEMGFTKTKSEETGRPPYSPYAMLKLYIYGYFNKVRSSRKLEKETHRNVEVMWLLNNLKPDHKTISRFRKDNLAMIKKVFDSFVKICLQMNLYSRQLISIDSSQFAAVNSKERNFTAGKLQDRITRINGHIEKYLTEIEQNDNDENQILENENISEVIAILKARKQKYEELLETLAETSERQVSLTDPDSRLMTKLNSHKMAYNVQTAVEGNNAMIVDFEVTNATDRGHLHSLATKCKQVFETEELTSLADKGYISATDIANCIKDGIAANVCMDEDRLNFCVETDEPHEKPTAYTNGRTVYLKNRNICICPMGEVLYPKSYRKSRRVARFRNTQACANCTQKCTKEKYATHEVAMKSSAFSKEYDDTNINVKQVNYVPDKQLLKRRKSLSEHPFGIVKRCLGADYFLLKRFEGATAETAFAYLAFNLKRAITILGTKKLIEAIQA